MSTTNLYRALRELMPDAPLQVATVASVNTAVGTSVIVWPGGQQQTARGSSVAAGSLAFVRDGLIEGAAPALEFLMIEV